MRFFIVLFSGLLFPLSCLAFPVDTNGKMNDGVEYSLSFQQQNTDIVFSEQFDALSVISDTLVEVSFDSGITWELLETAEDPTHDGKDISELLLLPSPVSSFRFRTDSKDTLSFQFFALSSSPFFAGPAEYLIGYSRDTSFFDTLGIVKREAWGADESFRFVKPSSGTPVPTPSVQPTAPPVVSERDEQCNEWIDSYSSEFTTQNSIFSENGKSLLWSHRYSPSIKKFVIHHTAESVETLSSRTEEETMRAVYQYHAKNRGWGDIGYHFLIGPSGKIYEGKAGGDYVVGGHVYCANAQTIGIALMGNFETGNPSVEQVKSLEKLLDGLSQKYSLPLASSSWFHGKYTQNVVGHRDYGATACPGKFFYAILPSIASHTVNYTALSTTSIFAPKEILKTKIQGDKIIRMMGKIGSIPTKTLSFQNIGNTVWKKSEMVLELKKKGVKKEIIMNEEEVPVNGIATFTISAYEPIASNQSYSFTLKKKKRNIVGGKGKWKITLLDSPLNATVSPSPSPSPSPSVPSSFSSYPDYIRILLSYSSDHIILEGNDLEISTGGKTIAGGIRLDITKSSDGLLVNGKVPTDVIRVKDLSDGIVDIASWKRVPEWDSTLNDNQFRGTIEIRVEDGNILVINELPVEDYLKGLAEVSDSAPEEKQKVLAIIARTYATFYLSQENRKYPGKPYDGDDSPESFQKYLGYGYEKRSPAFSQAVKNTNNMVITFQGVLVKTPYFSESDGRTRSAKEVWGWENTPYLKAVDDTVCKNGTGTLKGHGVGLSGCGAESMALSGYSYEEILKYYYTGVEIMNKE